MAVIEIAKIQVRRGQENLTGIPQLAPGEFGWAQDTENLYIGKRIVEGANNDENSRILTQKDYDNLFAIAMGAGRAAVASTSTYRYRDNLDFALFASTTTFIGRKLDAFVSLTDFGLIPSNTATDIYPKLTTAIQNLYANLYFHGETRRKLLIPAGNYYLSNTVSLPPYTTLVGEGVGMTNIISLTNDKPLFKTVDGAGLDFNNTMAEQQSMNGSRNVVLQGMTLAYTTSTSTAQPLVMFDNTENSKIENVEFTILRVVNTSTGTILISTSTVHGVGLSLRGQRRSGIEQNKNVNVLSCQFKNIGIGILGTGSVASSLIEANNFTELTHGVKFEAFSNDLNRLSPTKAIITRNNFENIKNQAIFIGTSTDQVSFRPNQLNHNSSFNNFYRVGNGLAIGDGITSNTGTAVISCYGEGFNSIGDKFSRKEWANWNLKPEYNNFFYKPILEGNGFVDAGTSLSIGNLAYGIQIIDRLYVGDIPVSYKIPYNLSDGTSKYTRSGVLTVTLSANPNYASTPVGSISDYYDFSFDPTWSVAAVGSNYDLAGDVLQPYFSLEPATGFLANNSFLYLTYNYPISPPPSILTFVATVTNITNNLPAEVTTLNPHGLSSGTQILLQGVQGMSNFFSNAGASEYYAWVLSANTFALYWDGTLQNPLDTNSLSPYNPASTATVVTLSGSSQMKIQYQTNIIS